LLQPLEPENPTKLENLTSNGEAESAGERVTSVARDNVQSIFSYHTSNQDSKGYQNMKEKIYTIAHKAAISSLVMVTTIGVYLTTVGAYGIISRRVAYSLSDGKKEDNDKDKK
jgi:signal transduction histidine kinase